MKGFNTYRDRILKATGENSDIDWQSLPQDVAQELLDKIGNGSYNNHNCLPAGNPSCSNNCIVTLFGRNFTLQATMMLSGLVLQLFSVIAMISIACKIKN